MFIFAVMESRKDAKALQFASSWKLFDDTYLIRSSRDYDVKFSTLFLLLSCFIFDSFIPPAAAASSFSSQGLKNNFFGKDIGRVLSSI